MNCGTCTHWDLKGSPLRVSGFGLCKKEEGVFAKARAFGDAAPCNKAQFEQAPENVIQLRRKALGGAACK